MYRQSYKIEDTVLEVSKAAYLASLLEKGILRLDTTMVQFYNPVSRVSATCSSQYCFLFQSGDFSFNRTFRKI